MLTEMMQFFTVIRREDQGARFLIVTRDDPALARSPALDAEVDPAAISIVATTYEEIPNLIALADASVFFIKTGVSGKAVSPTKLAELLAMGVPIVCNAGIGDCDEILGNTGAGVIVDEMTETAFQGRRPVAEGSGRILTGRHPPAGARQLVPRERDQAISRCLGVALMIEYTCDPDGWIELSSRRIACFHSASNANIDPETVASFGEEWTKFDRFSDMEIQRIGDEYFDVVTEAMLPAHTTALDLGCGGGRWSQYVASLCAFVEAVDPSEAVLTAHSVTGDLANVRVTQASVDTLPFPDDSFDFILCLGALHHIPDTAAALEAAVRKLRPGGWMLLYIYYALENRGPGYRLLFGAADLLRRVVSRLPGPLKRLSCDVLAVTVYLPLVALAGAVRILLGKGAAEAIPLHYYFGKSWRVIRNDALDRFGTPLEQRFTREEIAQMMTRAGLEDLRFSDRMPMWHAVGRKDHEGRKGHDDRRGQDVRRGDE